MAWRCFSSPRRRVPDLAPEFPSLWIVGVLAAVATTTWAFFRSSKGVRELAHIPGADTRNLEPLPKSNLVPAARCGIELPAGIVRVGGSAIHRRSRAPLPSFVPGTSVAVRRFLGLRSGGDPVGNRRDDIVVDHLNAIARNAHHRGRDRSLTG